MYVIGRECYLDQSHTWYPGQNNDPDQFISPQFTAQREWKLEEKLQVSPLKRYIKKYIFSHPQLQVAENYSYLFNLRPNIFNSPQ